MTPTKLRITRGHDVPARLRLTEAQHAELAAWGARHPELWAHRPPEPAEYATRRDAYREARTVAPRERPGLHRPVAGLDAVTEGQMAAYVAVDAFVRDGLQPETVRALVYLESFGKGD